MPEWQDSTDIDVQVASGVLSAVRKTTTTMLKEWTEGEAYEATSTTFDSDGVVTTATVKWPDGSAGTFTTTTKNSTWLAVDAYTISHSDNGVTVTQASVTRNSDGAITSKPALAVA